MAFLGNNLTLGCHGGSVCEIVHTLSHFHVAEVIMLLKNRIWLVTLVSIVLNLVDLRISEQCFGRFLSPCDTFFRRSHSINGVIPRCNTARVPAQSGGVAWARS